MSAQPETKERIYALEKLMGDRAAILKDSTELLTNRAKIDKYREKNLPRAQDAYLELQKTQKRILESLRDAQHDLLEMEEDALASTAEKLYQGFSGFNLMSRNYEPVYKVLTGFAEQLPESQDTVNAQVIGRLMNNVRMGYYPTDPENIECILRGIKFPAGVTTNVFDPCCGCGKALRQIANGNNCFAYGVELDELRAEEAQNRLHRVGIGSFFFSRISREAMHLMFLNPPYLNVLTEGGNKTRYEKRFLVESMGHLMIDGVLIYVIPYYRLTADICRILSDNFTDLGVWRFTDKEFSKFKQVAVIGIRKKRDEDPDAAAWLESLSYASADIPVITEIEEDRYPVPGTEKTVEVFKGEKFNEKELERQLSRSDSIQRMMNAKSELDRGTKHPLLPLSIGQIGLVGGSGMINGLIECDTPHVIKGRIVKLFKDIGGLEGEIKELEARRFDGTDLSDVQERLTDLSARYEEMAREAPETADTSEIDAGLKELHQKLGERGAEQYAPKYAEAIAETTAKVKDVAVRYKRDEALLKGFTADTVCPMCRRAVTAKELPAVQAEIKKSVDALFAEGKELKGQLDELNALEKQTEATFRQFQADDVKTMQDGIAELEKQRESLIDAAAAQNERRKADMDAMLTQIRALSAETDCGSLSMEDFERLNACKAELKSKNTEYAAAMLIVNSEAQDFDAKIKDAEEKIAAKKKLIAAAAQYVGKRAELLFSSLKMNRVEISLFDVVKSTGEVKDTFKFTYNGRRYDRLSLSEKIRAGMEVSELMKRLTGRNYPQFIDNMESVDDLRNVTPSGQVIMAMCVHGAELSIRPKQAQQMPKAA